MTWPSDIQSNTPPKYQFKLLSQSRNIICEPEPLEWAEGSISIKRSLEIGGVFSSFVSDSLTFVGNGAELLKELKESSSFNAECTLVISWYKESTRAYIEMPSRFKVNFSFFKIVKVLNFAFGVQIKAINSSTQTKLNNRKKDSIDITKLFSIGGYNIVDYPNLLKDFRFGEINAFASAEHSDTNTWVVNDTDEIFEINQSVILSDFGIQSHSTVFNTNQVLHKEMGFFLSSTEDRTLTVSIEIDINIPEQLNDGWFEFRYAILNDNDSVDSDIRIQRIDDRDSSGIINITFARTTNILSGQSIVLYGSAHEDTPPGVHDIEITRVNITYQEAIVTSTPVTIEAFPIYEIGERLAQHILDVQFPFYSEYFGRLDTPYNQNGDVYLSEDQKQFASVMSGLNLRGDELANTNNPLALSFEDYVRSLRVRWNAGYTLETIGGFERIRFEEYSFFFDNNIVLDLSDRINKYDIESELMPELAYLSLESGYEEFSYESINGRGEYNSKNLRTSIIQTDAKLNNVDKLRGDTRGITLQLERSIKSDGTKDEKEDNSIFVIKSQRSAEPNEDWKAETDENITIEDNSSLFQEGSLNLFNTGSRNLIRGSNRFSGAFQKFQSSKLRFQNSGKLQTLKTTGEGYTITENDDIIAADLNDPIYLPEKHTVSVRFDFEDIETFNTNPLGLIKLSDDAIGWVLDIKKQNKKDEAVITIIQKHVS